MTIFALPNGKPDTASKVLTGSNTTIKSVGDTPARPIVVTSLLIVNQDGSARTVTLERYDGSTGYKVLDEKSVPANDYISIETQLYFGNGWRLRGLASAADVVTVHANYVELTQ